MTHNLLPFMHTEDDTFNALRRIPYREMRKIVFRIRLSVMLGIPAKGIDEALQENGWTKAEYDAHVVHTDEYAIKTHDFGMRRHESEGIILKPTNLYKARHG